MIHTLKFAVVAAITAAGALTAAPARAECFLKLDGVKGESTDMRHRDEIEITGFSWGVTQSASAHTSAGAGSGTANIADLKLSKLTDRSTPTLAQFSVNGSLVKSAVVSCRANSRSADYITITLESALISSFKISVERERPIEELTLNFRKIKMEQRQTKPDGSAGPAVTFTYDVAARH